MPFEYLDCPGDKNVPLLVGDAPEEEAYEEDNEVSQFALIVPEWGGETGWRNRCRMLVLGNKWFERFWLFVIVLNCITLSMEDPLDKDCNSSMCRFTTIADYTFSLLFVLECAIKVAGLSFYTREDAYLRDEWNVLDFIIVIAGLLVVFFELVLQQTGPGLAGLRAFRLLRPLKAVQAFPAVRILVQSILASLPQLLDVFILYFFFVLIMGIIAVQQWRGLFRWHCVSDESLAAVDAGVENATLEITVEDRACAADGNPNLGAHLCEWGSTCLEFGGNPSGGKLSFDNIGITALTLFVALTLEGWTDTMYTTIDVTTYLAAVFWVILVVFGSFFILNLTIVIITEAFEMKQYEQRTAAFNAIDKDGGGELDRDEVRQLLEKSSGKHVTEEDLDKVFNEMDKDGGGTVSREEFLAYTETHAAAVGMALSRRGGATGFGSDMAAMLKKAPGVNWMTRIVSAIKGFGEPKSPLRHWLYQIVEPTGKATTLPGANKVFRIGVMVVILLNTIVLSVEHHGQPQDMTDILAVLNTAFTIIFMAEATFKVLALGLYDYFNDSFNCFDFVISVLSFVELFGVAEGANVSVFRTFRALRVLRLAKQVPLLQRWIGILLNSMKGAAILTGLLSLAVFIVSLIGMQLFGGEFCFLDDDWDPEDPHVTPEELIKGPTCGGVPRSNYDNLGNSLMTSFQILTGEDWNVIMYNGMTAVGDWVSLYFVLYYILGNYMMLNLFIAVLLSSRDLKDSGSADSVSGGSGDHGGELLESPTEPNGALKDDPYSPGASWRKLGSIQDEPASPTAKAEEVFFHGAEIQTSEGHTRVADDTLFSKSKKEWRPLWLQDLMESERSLLFFEKHNRIRVTMLLVIESTIFEMVVLGCIAVSTVTLALESPLRPPDHPTERVLLFINFIMIWVFLAEAVFKIVGMGFIFHKTSYLRSEGWNILDFFIVVVSILSITVPAAEEIEFVKIMRTLRPLRFINKSAGMKVVVQALLRSISPLMNVLLISLMVWLIFGIMGVQIFSGKFHRCSVNEYGDMEERDPPIIFKSDCLNTTLCPGEDGNPCRWLNYDSHFDNLPAAFLNLFEMASLEGWVDVMYLGIDAVSADEAPRKNHNPAMALYFLIFIVFGAFFIINMFIGVLIDTYYQEKEKASHGGIFLNDKQKLWVDHHTKMLNLMKVTVHEETEEKDTMLNTFITSVAFELFIIGCIVVNVLVMSLEYYPASDTYNSVLNIINDVFYGIFLLEAILKIINSGPRGYFLDPWNKFDFSIVFISTIGLIMSLVLSSSPVVSMFRVLRLARLLRMVKKAQGIKRILRTLYLSLPSMFNVAGILSLMFFVYAVLGVKLFARLNRIDASALGPHANFENFGYSLLLLLRMTTGEAWQAVLKDASVSSPYDCDPHLNECGHKVVATIFFCTFTLSGMYVLLNLFIAVILDAFSRSDDENVCSEEYMDSVRDIWQNYQQKIPGSDTGGISPNELESFLQEIGPPLGVDSSCSKKDQTAFLMSLDLKIDPVTDLVPQNELIPKLFAAKYGQDLPEEIQQQLREKEKDLELTTSPVQLDGPSLTYQLAVVRAQACIRGYLTRSKLRKAARKEKQRKARQPYEWARNGNWPSGQGSRTYRVYLRPPAGGVGVPLGFGVHPDTGRVTRVTRNTTAHKCGLTPGLRILSVNSVKPQDASHAAQLVRYVTAMGRTAELEVETPDPTDMLMEQYAGDDYCLNFHELCTMCRDIGIAGPVSYPAYERACEDRDLDPEEGYTWRDAHELMTNLPDVVQQRVLGYLKLVPVAEDPDTTPNPLSPTFFSRFHNYSPRALARIGAPVLGSEQYGSGRGGYQNIREFCALAEVPTPSISSAGTTHSPVSTGAGRGRGGSRALCDLESLS